MTFTQSALTVLHFYSSCCSNTMQYMRQRLSEMCVYVSPIGRKTSATQTNAKALLQNIRDIRRVPMIWSIRHCYVQLSKLCAKDLGYTEQKDRPQKNSKVNNIHTKNCSLPNNSGRSIKRAKTGNVFFFSTKLLGVNVTWLEHFKHAIL